MGESTRRVAVVGAGAAGLCAAKVMGDAGFDVVVFEIGSKIGGMWCYENDNQLSSAYRTLHINTSRNVTRFTDLDFERDVQDFPDHVDMQRYLARYSDNFNITERIRFNSTVTNIQPDFDPAKDKPKWLVTVQDNEPEVFDSVIVATGHLHVPRHVSQFRDEFTGEYLHSHYYREPDRFVGKRVCVVGVGNSACDIASDLCVTSQRCVLVARSGVLILPKLIFGRPFTDLSSKLQKPWVPYGVRRRIIKAMTWLVHGDMHRLGFKRPDTRVHTTSNGTIVTDIAYRRIHVKQGISRIDADTIEFADGSKEQFDVLIGATGYKTDLSFLESGLVRQDDTKIDLYKRIVPPDWPGLYLMGFFNTDTALMFIFEHQAKWIREIELGNATLPTPEAMQQDLEQRRAWVSANYRDTRRHDLEEESVPYIQALKKSLKVMRSSVH